MFPVDTDGYTVDVRIGLTSNVSSFESALENMDSKAQGGAKPESTDECLNTVVNDDAHQASTRTNPDGCSRPAGATPVLQVGDFSPDFNSGALKLIVVLTDAGPGGFCDVENSYTTTDAHDYANDAAESGIQINAIQMLLTEADGGVSSDDLENLATAASVMADYAATSHGWFEQLPYGSSSSDLEDAILYMVYTAGAN